MMTMSRGRSRSDSPSNIQKTISGHLYTITPKLSTDKAENSLFHKGK